MESKRKIGRNDLCPCGSGKKYKKCHGIPKPMISPQFSNPLHDPEIKKRLDEINAVEMQRVKQQGQGRPVISTIFKGFRFVAVGNRFYYSKKWQTFHDFLATYIHFVFGKDWLISEKNKGVDAHPILNWIDLIRVYREQVFKNTDKNIISSPMIGAVFAYQTLSYNLYLIAHNIHLVHGEGLHKRLIERLKKIESFYPAFYETMVAASFIKAGFRIELENESDPSSAHSEFIATSSKTSRKYSVEAKHRQIGKEHAGIQKQLYNALKKDLPHERVIFINLNIPQNMTSEGRLSWLDDVLCQMRSGESIITIKGKPAPQAYVFVTNHPFLYNLDSFNFPPAVVAEGFKITDFKLDSSMTLREALMSRGKHIDMLDLMKAMKEYDSIPCTFDGEIPEYAFGEINEPRLKIGEKYLITENNGTEVIAELVDCVVSASEKKVYCMHRLKDGQTTIGSYILSDLEFQAYMKHPDTFFGVYKKQDHIAKDVLDLYDFFYSVYKNSSKEKLLEFLKGHKDIEKLSTMPQEELAKVYCELLVYST